MNLKGGEIMEEKGQKLANKLADFKDQYRQGVLTLDELVLFCCRAGIDATQEIVEESKNNLIKKGKS